jgi:asparagine synthase (glutamine-hydrolysing)
LGAVKSQIVRPAWIHLRQGVHLPGAPKEAWRDYSAINLELARELDITGQMMQGGYDPTFKPKKDPVEARLQIVAPGTTIVGHIYHEFGAAYNLEVRDPTADPRLMEFCWSVPVGQYVRDGHNRMLIRRAMAGYIPDEVLWNLRKGVQGSDVAQRVFDHRSDIEAALSKVERSELACHYLDLPKMRRVFDSVQHRIEPKNREPCVTILLRGLAVGLFLLRFD